MSIENTVERMFAPNRSSMGMSNIVRLKMSFFCLIDLNSHKVVIVSVEKYKSIILLNSKSSEVDFEKTSGSKKSKVPKRNEIRFL